MPQRLKIPRLMGDAADFEEPRGAEREADFGAASDPGLSPADSPGTEPAGERTHCAS